MTGRVRRSDGGRNSESSRRAYVRSQLPGRRGPGPVRQGRGRCAAGRLPGRQRRRPIASELAANAAVHSRSAAPGGWFTVRAEVRDGDYVWIEVEDQGGPWACHAHDDDHPHGLDLVDALAGDGNWGIDGDASHGRTVWARLDWPGKPGRRRSPPDQTGGAPGQHTANRSRPEGCDKAAPSPDAPPVPGNVPALPAQAAEPGSQHNTATARPWRFCAGLKRHWTGWRDQGRPAWRPLPVIRHDRCSASCTCPEMMRTTLMPETRRDHLPAPLRAGCCPQVRAPPCGR